MEIAVDLLNRYCERIVTGSCEPCGLCVRWALSDLFFSETDVEFDQVAIGIFKPELVQRRPHPRGARRLFDVPSRSTGAATGVDYGALVRQLNAEMVQSVVMEFLSVGH